MGEPLKDKFVYSDDNDKSIRGFTEEDIKLAVEFYKKYKGKTNQLRIDNFDIYKEWKYKDEEFNDFLFNKAFEDVTKEKGGNENQRNKI